MLIRPGERIRKMSKAKDVRAAVEKELDFDPLIKAADITVVDIAGNVALNGTVSSYPQYLEAALPDSDFRDDAMLTTAANNALAHNVTVPDGVEATADDGNLTLTGTVSYGTERAAAETAISGLIGVRNVRNDIDISYGIDPVDVDLHVQQALDRSALVPDGSDVSSETKDGVITL